MAVEEQEWRRAQSPDPSMSRDSDDPVEDVNESMDEGLETDTDDDIIPGCYLLDIGIGVSKLWIRADYIRIYASSRPIIRNLLPHRSRHQLPSSQDNRVLVSSRTTP